MFQFLPRCNVLLCVNDIMQPGILPVAFCNPKVRLLFASPRKLFFFIVFQSGRRYNCPISSQAILCQVPHALPLQRTAAICNLWSLSWRACRRSGGESGFAPGKQGKQERRAVELAMLDNKARDRQSKRRLHLRSSETLFACSLSASKKSCVLSTFAPSHELVGPSHQHR